MNNSSDLDAILIGLGANLPSSFGEPRQTLEAALALLAERGISVAARSSWWKTRPVPESDQPWFVNGVIRLGVAPKPWELLDCLDAIERICGRVRGLRNAARTLDLDILTYGRLVVAEPDLIVPHPRLGERAFVLHPMKQLVPAWRHPQSGEPLDALIARLPADQIVQVLEE